MRAVGKMGLLTGAVACALLGACHGGSSSTPSTTPPTVGTFSCPVVANTSSIAGIAVTCATATTPTTADGSAPNYSWVFGDQTPTGSTQATTGEPVTHVYAQPGSYLVTLNVSDDHGTTTSRVETITVSGTPATVDGVESWAWVNGSKYANSAGDFQTQLKPSPSNQPSARQNASTWTNSTTGKLWMFGGSGYDSTGAVGVLNDIWVYDPSSTSSSSNQWTWIGGSSHANAAPVYPKNSSGNAIPGTASTNVIGARTAAAQWTDSKGNFWLFGGSGYDINSNSSYLSDLWMLNPLTGEATYVGGSAVGNTAATGTQGVANTANIPAGRAFATTWVDKNGIFWLFGGQGYSTSTNITFNDLWSYDPNPQSATHPNGQQGWLWVSGGTAPGNAAGTYGTLATAAASNYPGGRVSAQSWVDSSGNLWMFGGDGYDSADTYGPLNDLWMYNTSSGQWTWVAGSNIEGAASVYGTEGSSVPASGTTNTPSARVGTIGWVDTSGNFWLFAGSGTDSTGTASTSDGGGALNELWNFNTTTKLWTWMGGVNVEGTAGVYITQNPSTTGSKYNSPGSRVWSSGWVDASGNFWLFGGTGLDSEGTSGYLNDLWNVQLTVQPTH